MNFADLLGYWTAAACADCLGLTSITVLGFSGAAASTLLIEAFTSPVSKAVLGGWQQFAQAWSWVALGTLACEVFPTESRGFYMGVIFVVNTILTTIAPVVGGAMFD